jgi:hypothetical protein
VTLLRLFGPGAPRTAEAAAEVAVRRLLGGRGLPSEETELAEVLRCAAASHGEERPRAPSVPADPPGPQGTNPPGRAPEPSTFRSGAATDGTAQPEERSNCNGAAGREPAGSPQLGEQQEGSELGDPGYPDDADVEDADGALDPDCQHIWDRLRRSEAVCCSPLTLVRS